MERVVRLIAAASMVTVIGCSTIDEVSTDIGIKDPDFCVRLEATPRANFFEGQPHVVRLLIHPLTDTIGFEEASESSLIAGKAPKGKTGEPVELRVVPGEKRTLTRPLPPGTHWLGVVADYYRPPGMQAGPRKLAVEVNCADGGPLVLLDETELKLP